MVTHILMMMTITKDDDQVVWGVRLDIQTSLASKGIIVISLLKKMNQTIKLFVPLMNNRIIR